MADGRSGSRLTAHINYPSCWDGVLPRHTSTQVGNTSDNAHFAYRLDSRTCPPGFPVKTVELRMTIQFQYTGRGTDLALSSDHMCQHHRRPLTARRLLEHLGTNWVRDHGAQLHQPGPEHHRNPLRMTGGLWHAESAARIRLVPPSSHGGVALDRGFERKLKRRGPGLAARRTWGPHTVQEPPQRNSRVLRPPSEPRHFAAAAAWWVMISSGDLTSPGWR